MCVCLTINARRKFRIKNLHTLPNKTDGYAAMFLLQYGGRHFCWYHDLPEPQKGRFGRSVETPQTTQNNVLAPESTLTRVNSHSPLCQLVPCVNSSPSQLVPGSTRTWVNSSPSQLVLGSAHPRVNSNSGQLVPESTRPRVNSPRVNSSPCRTSSPSQLAPSQLAPSQLVPGSTPVPGQLAPTSTRTLVIPQPSQLAHRSTCTQVPAYHTTHLPIYLHYLPRT